MKRKIIQIAAIPNGESVRYSNTIVLFALCADGTLWRQTRDTADTWEEIKNVPDVEDLPIQEPKSYGTEKK